MSLLNFASGLFGNSAQGALAPDSEELSSLLKTVLPTFIAAVDRRRDALLELHSLETPQQSTQPLDKLLWDFYPRLYAGLMNLQAVLVQWSPEDLIQSSSAEEAQMRLLLGAVLSCIEERFLSRKEKNAGPAFKRLGIEQTGGTTLWKLRALGKSKRLPTRDEEMPQSYLRDIDLVIRLDSKRAAKRDELLRVVEAAFEFFIELQFFNGEPTSSCPLQYLNYPMKHVSKLTKTLFGVIQSKWSCQCNGSQSHVSRKARWNLTQHQRFDTTPIRDAVRKPTSGNDVQSYRVFFPTTARETEWQDTDIAVDFRQQLDEESRKIDNDLCKVISSVKAGIRPRMTVWAKELWLLRASAEESSSVLTQIKEAEFVSLTELFLQQSSYGRGRSSRGSLGNATWRPRDRLILSFILATTLLHLFKTTGLRLKAGLNSDSICFLRPTHRTPLDMTRPYLTISCASHSSTHHQKTSSGWNQPHRFPDILALGILLLEIERGVPIKVDASQDPCVVAMKEFDDWTMSSGLSTAKRSVPEGLRHAIAACIQPKQLKTHNLDKTSIQDNDVRRYIFDRILYPLEEALFTAYEIRPHMLLGDSERNGANVEGSGSFDGEEDIQVDKYQRAAADEWTTNLEGVHDLVYACQEQYEELTPRNWSDRRAGRVRFAVLDTGLQLPEYLRANYEADGRILVNESKSFVRKTDGAASEQDWDSDRDGHGSRVGEIILRYAPCADLHVAKVFQTRQDLDSPALAAQVHQQIAEAIDVATNTWKVDMIVVCFGFDEPIRPIRDAIDRATKSSKPPLFFAATRNNGAHREIAWPASDFSVIGISSTTAEGETSPFNSRERDDAYPILYAFGQSVPVKVTAPDNPKHFVVKYVSGTSYATPVAASLAANLLGSVRMLLQASSPEDHARFAHVPVDLQKSRGMLRVLQSQMQREHVSGQKSLLPWDFLRLETMKENKLLKEVDGAMNGKLFRG